MLLAGLAGSACSQEAQEPVKVGTAQVELRSDLVLPEMPGASPLPEEHPDQSRNLMPATRSAVKRHEVPFDLREGSKTGKSSVREDNAATHSWTLGDKPWVRAGKGFGVAAEGMTPPGSVHPDDGLYYVPTSALKSYSKVSEQLEPIAEPFPSRKPLIFHSRATGFAHELPADATHYGQSPAFEERLVLSPIPETQVYLSSHRTQVTLAPAKNRLDLMNGNENLNRNRFHQRNAGPGLSEAK
jgi:hypothetical protein